MEPASNSTNLESRIAQWQKSLSGGALTSEDIEELTIQLTDSLEEYSAKGLNENDAWLLAMNHIGTAKIIDEEFSKVNPDFSASRNWMMLLWGALGFFLVQSLFIQIPILINYIRLPGQKTPLSEGTTTVVFYLTAFFVLLLTFFLAFKWRSFISWFNIALATNSTVFVLVAIFSGLFATFINFLMLSSSLLNKAYWSDSMQAFSALTVTFYIALIGLTSYMTFRYRLQEFRSFKAFAKNLGWKQALIFGFLTQAIIQFSLSYGTNYLPLAIIVPCFGAIGWMLSYSKNWLNLVSAQFVPMLMFIFGWQVNEGARIFFLTEYLFTLLALILAYFVGRYQFQRKLA